VTSLLADVLCEQGKMEEAGLLARRALEISAPDDIDPQTRAKSVLALALARSGDGDSAEAMAREAVEASLATDLIMILADALRRQGQVLALSGKEEEAVAVLNRALAAYEQKGNAVMAARVRESLGARASEASGA